MTPGRWVATKAPWKPQTKKPADNSKKLRSRNAARMAPRVLAAIWPRYGQLRRVALEHEGHRQAQ
jgi:hypothetical protein